MFDFLASTVSYGFGLTRSRFMVALRHRYWGEPRYRCRAATRKVKSLGLI